MRVRMRKHLVCAEAVEGANHILAQFLRCGVERGLAQRGRHRDVQHHSAGACLLLDHLPGAQGCDGE